MPQYAIPQSPETIFTVSGKDSPKAREKAMALLEEAIADGTLDAELVDGFGPDRLVVVEPTPLGEEPGEAAGDEIGPAVQVLANFASLRLKHQELREEAQKIRHQLDTLFGEAPVTEEEVMALKKGFKVLEAFAQINRRYSLARQEAEAARQVLDRALQES
ncbi:MAG: hypothetical protein HC918_03815 [Oscillatoriales cyanobacterium SM2_1_8]|nr:hypothetical protein [Oscillatoriales cyanobacterium SM2_1_8]